MSSLALNRSDRNRLVPDAGATTAAPSSQLSSSAHQQFDRFKQAYDAGLDQKWQIEVQKKLFEFVNLKKGWDSYDAPSLRRDAGFFALEVLNNVMRPRTPPPQVVPSGVGGVQFEWHQCDMDIELHVTAPYHCEFWCEDRRTGEQISEELTTDFSLPRQALNELTKR